MNAENTRPHYHTLIVLVVILPLFSFVSAQNNLEYVSLTVQIKKHVRSLIVCCHRGNKYYMFSVIMLASHHVLDGSELLFTVCGHTLFNRLVSIEIQLSDFGVQSQ